MVSSCFSRVKDSQCLQKCGRTRDGAHIKNLFYTFIWTCCPQLVKDGYIYAGQPPLYKITEGKDKYLYLKNDSELETYQRNNAGKRYTVSRYKGLGEMDAEESDILIDPALRTWTQVAVDDSAAADRLFEDLMGSKVEPRKDFIKQHAKEATYNE